MVENYWPWYLGGASIAVIVLTVVIITGKFLSVTRGYVALCSIITKKAYFNKTDIGGPMGFRSMFVIGIIIGGFLAAIYNGGFQPSWKMGTFDQLWGSILFGNALVTKAVVLIIGGFMWGYGSRMARGCTSGNAISGLSRGSLASLIAMVGFMVGGIPLTFLLEYLLK